MEHDGKGPGADVYRFHQQNGRDSSGILYVGDISRRVREVIRDVERPPACRLSQSGKAAGGKTGLGGADRANRRAFSSSARSATPLCFSPGTGRTRLLSELSRERWVTRSSARGMP